MSAQARLLPDGRRLHLPHGPIDLIVEAFGNPAEIAAAYQQASVRFKTILEELCEETGPRYAAPTNLGAEVQPLVE